MNIGWLGWKKKKLSNIYQCYLSNARWIDDWTKEFAYRFQH